MHFLAAAIKRWFRLSTTAETSHFSDEPAPSSRRDPLKYHPGKFDRIIDRGDRLRGIVDGLAAQADGGNERSRNEQRSPLPFLGTELGL